MRVERIGEGLGKRFAIAVCMYIVEEALSGTWRARLRAEAPTPVSCHGTDGGVSGHVGELGCVPSSCSIHAHVMACRRSRSAPLGSLRRSALLVSTSWTPRSAGVSCPVPVVLSSFVVSHSVAVVVQLGFPSCGKQVLRSSEIRFARQNSTQPGW